MNHDKGHWLTGADIVDVMSHAGIGRLQGADEVDTASHGGVLNTIKIKFAFVDQPLRTDCCSRATLT